MRFDVRHNFGDVAKRHGQLRDDLQEKAIARSLNRIVDRSRTEMGREISAEFNITKREVNDNLVVSKASVKAGRLYLTATLAAPSRKKGRGFNLIRFVTGRRVVGRKGAPQLKFKIKRSGGLKSVTGAFIGNKGRTVFIRQGNKRLPIKSLTTIDVPQMFNTKRINAKVLDMIRRELPIEIERNIKFLTRPR